MNYKNYIIGSIILVLILVGATIYFTVGKKSELTNNQPVVTNNTNNITNQTNPAPIGPTANWKTYSNTRYAYTIKYPTSWFVDTTYSENDFTLRESDIIGGDTIWSNYQNPNQYDLGTVPSDLEAVFLLIYKTDAQTTLDTFINLKNFLYSNKESVNINGLSGIRLTNDLKNGLTSKIVLLKAGNNVFDFSHSINSARSATVMDQMLQNFQLE